RLETSQAELLTLRVVDDIGQVTEQQLTITVIPDLAPDASRLLVNYPETGFYGESIPVRVNGFTAANQGTDSVLVSFLEVNPASGKQTHVEHISITQEL